MTEHPPGLIRRLWLSIFSEPIVPRNDRDRKRLLHRYLLFHIRPPTVPEKTLQFTLSWGLGGMAVVLVLLQFVTGVLLKFVYVPVPAQAYASIIHLQQEVPFGAFIRNIHHWSANLLVAIAVLHLLRVFFTIKRSTSLSSPNSPLAAEPNSTTRSGLYRATSRSIMRSISSLMFDGTIARNVPPQPLFGSRYSFNVD